VRHLVLSYPKDENVYDLNDEFMLGEGLLIAPILTENTFEREVYLPEGKWEDLNTGAVYTVGAEGKTIKVDVSIAEIPTFYNMNTTSETAAELLGGIRELYDYARSVAP
jgi:alpha-glucosidase (family GH31 glycosyl hydrolase)